MKTILEKICLSELLKQPILFDANIFMVGIENRLSDSNYSFENIKNTYLVPVFESFKNIVIHEEVFKELDEECRRFITNYIGLSTTIVKENGLYGKDPLYTTIFNMISNNKYIKYKRGDRKDRGEIYSLTYAVYNGINYFCSKEIMVELLAEDLPVLSEVNIITFDIIVLQAYIYHNLRNDNSKNKALKSIYKRYCSDVIKRHKLPETLLGYLENTFDYVK